MDILVIDDDLKIRELMAFMLEEEGHSVLQAESGLDALSICNKRNIDLLITDIIMPKKGGMRTIIEVKNSFPKVPVIAMSGGGYLEPGDYLDYALKVGANATIKKPFRKQELLTLIDKITKINY